MVVISIAMSAQVHLEAMGWEWPVTRVCRNNNLIDASGVVINGLTDSNGDEIEKTFMHGSWHGRDDEELICSIVLP